MDPLWKTVNSALGAADGTSEINIAENSYSSSLRKMLEVHELAAPESRYIGKEMVQVCRLDSVFKDYRIDGANTLLKIDAQGYERDVVSGAEESLKEIVGVQMEVGLIELYEGETLLVDMLQFMADCGFSLMSIDPAFIESDTGRVLQTECMFFRC